MSAIKLTPTYVGYLRVKADLQDFNVMHLKFAEKMNDYAKTDYLDLNRLTNFEMSIVGWNTICRLNVNESIIISNDVGELNIKCLNKTVLSAYLSVYRGSTKSFDLSFRGANFYDACGLILAEFSDGIYTIGSYEVGYNPSSPPTGITLEPPTDTSFGYMLCNSTSYRFSNHGLRFTDEYRLQANILANSIVKKNVDPYEKGGNTSIGGGTGTFDGTSTPVSVPNLPTLSAVDTGFITLFNPTLSEMKNLANYMWSDLFDLDGWKKIFADPMDAILGLSLVPVSVPDGGQKTVTVGNISTGVSMNKAGSQFVTVDCGSIEVKEFWGSYLDYAPYTKSELYLPYCGTHPIDIDDIMGKTIHIVYHVDILSGACCAYVQCGESVLYTFVGQCSVSIPITGNDWTNVVNGALTVGASIGTMVATGGASAPMAVQTIASTAVNSLKPSVEKSGALSGMGGMLANQTPYLIITLPRQAVPENQNTFMGYPSFVTATLSECSGYTEVDKIHLENVNATDKELDEIELLLKSGVII